MRRLAWSQLRFRPGRALALLLGMLVATTAFTVLTAASRTSQLRTIGAVSAHFQAAYDILVRPRDARTPLENATGTVQPNFLSGVYGGISLAQYRQIRRIAGVQVAAPIAMVGYSMPVAPVTVRLPAAATARPGRQLYRVTTTWVSAAGTSRVRQPASFVYITPDRLAASNSSAAGLELLPDGSRKVVCPGVRGTSPFGAGAQADNWCWSKINGAGPGSETFGNLTGQHPGFTVRWLVPMLIAAIDPAAEARLDGLNHALTSGRYLPEHAGSQPAGVGGTSAFPVLAAAGGGLDEYAQTVVQQLASPATVPSLDLAGMRAAGAAPGRTVLTTRTTAQQAYQELLGLMTGKTGRSAGITGYWTVSPTRYRRGAGGSLTPVLVRNPPSVWRSGFGPEGAPIDNEDHQYRALDSHAPASASFSGGIPVPRLSGVFDPARVQAFDRLAQVPLGPYQATAAAPADAASRAALGGAGLRPSLNLGGYVSQPVNLVTTLAALPTLENSSLFSGNLHRGSDQRHPRARGGDHRAERGLPGSDQRGRPADRGAHRPDGRHRRRLLPRSDDDRPACGGVRAARVSTFRRLGQEGRSGRDPDRRRQEERDAFRAHPRRLRPVRGQRGHRRGPRPPA